MDLVKAFGLAVRIIREKEKLTQEDLALRVGVHFTAIGRLERGEKQCRIDTMEAVASGFGIALSELIRRAEKLRELSLDVVYPPR